MTKQRLKPARRSLLSLSARQTPQTRGESTTTLRHDPILRTGQLLERYVMHRCGSVGLLHNVWLAHNSTHKCRALLFYISTSFDNVSLGHHLVEFQHQRENGQPIRPRCRYPSRLAWSCLEYTQIDSQDEEVKQYFLSMRSVTYSTRLASVPRPRPRSYLHYINKIQLPVACKMLYAVSVDAKSTHQSDT